MQLPRVLDLGAAAPLWSDLSKKREEDLVLDASDVERLGGLCLQVLMAAAASWRAAGKEFKIVHRSPAFDDAIERMGAQTLIVSGGAG